MQLATICKQFTFSAAHYLPHHNGQCKTLHGHTYKVEVLVTGMIRPADGESDEGMVLDFSDIKEIYRRNVEPLVEHQFLNESLLGTNLPVLDNGHALTSAEGMATWLLDVFSMALLTPGEFQNDRVKDVCVRLWESPTSYAESGNTPWRG